MASSLVSTQWLSEHYQDDNVIILYTRMCSPGSSILPEQPHEFIAGSQLFDFESIFCDLNSNLPHTLPTLNHFESHARKLGINNNSIVIVYDQVGIYASPRVWWMFKVFGFNNIYVLDGGLPAWRNANLPIQSALRQPAHKGDFTGCFQSQLVCEFKQVKNRVDNLLLVDARSPERFSGAQADPRVGVRAGHIPGSINIPFEQVLSKGFIKPPSELLHLFPSDRTLAFSCGSGVTACILALAANEVGLSKWSVYDGSWAEWGSSNEPIESRGQ